MYWLPFVTFGISQLQNNSKFQLEIIKIQQIGSS